MTQSAIERWFANIRHQLPINSEKKKNNAITGQITQSDLSNFNCIFINLNIVLKYMSCINFD